MRQGSDTLAFAWKNADGNATLYITNDASLNQITISMTNDTGAAVKFPQGTPVEPEKLPKGQSAVYLEFNGLVENDNIENMTFTADGWSSANFRDQHNRDYWAIAPSADVLLQKGDSVTFSLGNVVTQGPIGSGNVNFQYQGTSPIAGQTVQVFVNVVAPPSPDQVELNLLVGFAGTNQIFSGAPDNELVLFLTNPNDTPLTGTQGGNPRFCLTFVYGEGDGALTDETSGAHITVEPGNTFGNNWNVCPDPGSANPNWQLIPKSPSSILGVGENASSEFTIGTLVSNLNPGITFAYLSYQDIAGYNDGFFAIEIERIFPVEIVEFIATPAALSNITGPAAVTLSFTVDNASFVTIPGTSYGEAANSVSFSDSVEVSVQATTTFTLIAVNTITGQQVTQCCTVEVSPPLYQILPQGSIVMWSGAIDSIPAGWALCDGSNGTPDLRDKFVLGAGGTEAPNASGDADTHTHDVTVGAQTVSTTTDGSHKHGMTFSATGHISSGVSSHYSLLYGTNFGKPHSDDSTTDKDTHTDGDHQHSVTVDYGTIQSASQSGDIRPSWYSLAFIMKLQ